MASQMEVQKAGLEANIIENHDEPRGVSRFFPESAQNPAGTKMLGTVSVFLRGIPFIYQGQEIGMQNAVWGSIEEYDDISTKDQYHIAREAGLSNEEALEVCQRMSRDNARTPVQWSGEENAGFTAGTPWMKVNSNYTVINAESQEKQEDSVLNYYRKMTALRKSPEYKEVLTYGEFVPAYEETDTVMAYYRVDGEKRIMIAGNFGQDKVELQSEHNVKGVLLSNQGKTQVEKVLELESCEVIVLECV